jgi:hypothetical protein
MVMRNKLPRTLTRLWNRYRPNRKYVDLDPALLSYLSQLGYVELYRGEWFFTNDGVEAVKEGITILRRDLERTNDDS